MKIILGFFVVLFSLNYTFSTNYDETDIHSSNYLTDKLVEEITKDVGNELIDIFGDISEWMSGLVFQERNQFLFVTYIQEDSLADKAGLEVGDLIFKINDSHIEEGTFLNDD